MAATTLDAQTMLADALTLARRYRHYPECECGIHRTPSGAGFCTPEQALWSRALDRLIDQVLQGK